MLAKNNLLELEYIKSRKVYGIIINTDSLNTNIMWSDNKNVETICTDSLESMILNPTQFTILKVIQ